MAAKVCDDCRLSREHKAKHHRHLSSPAQPARFSPMSASVSAFDMLAVETGLSRRLPDRLGLARMEVIHVDQRAPDGLPNPTSLALRAVWARRGSSVRQRLCVRGLPRTCI